MTLTPARQKKCKACKESFKPFSSTASACSVNCAITLAKVQTSKAIAKDFKQRRQAAKTLGQLHKEAQPVFNRYIRLRDQGQPCISCQRHHTGQIHAGHYRSVGAAAELRYNETNVHAQCAPCNNHLSGNAIDYRINLIKKIGIDSVELLEGPHDAQKYNREQILAIKAQYKAKAKELINRGQ
tara:strand:+ start:126 stop:674 length:549 start_codon:yes stop_codon:yes gene_type:complete